MPSRGRFLELECPLLVQRAERKLRTKDEVDTAIFWLMRYDEAKGCSPASSW